ncbi:hypothetical protein MMC17_007126 [Xylographa soralifera]|nr:hypothetical protein [Xylographa soralifera]
MRNSILDRYFAPECLILQTQTAQIHTQLGPSHEFVFLDGEVECAAASGVSHIFPGPYRSFYPAIPTQTELEAAHSLVVSVLEEEGPFDGILGFSQGAALAASVLLEHTKKYGSRVALPVKCAVFICGSLPFMIPDGGCVDSEIVSDVQSIQLKQDNEKQSVPSISVVSITMDNERGGSNTIEHGLVTITIHDECTDVQLDPMKRAHPNTYASRISIPTAHIIGGRKDHYFEESKALAELGDEQKGIRIFTHGMGHVIPRGEQMKKAMADTITWAVNRKNALLFQDASRCETNPKFKGPIDVIDLRIRSNTVPSTLHPTPTWMDTSSPLKSLVIRPFSNTSTVVPSNTKPQARQHHATITQALSREAVARETNRNIRAHVRDNWEWPLLPTVQHNRIDAETKWCERHSDVSASSDSCSPDPYKFETPDSIASEVSSRKRKRRREFLEEMDWNEGLRIYATRRNDWTGGCVSSKATGATGAVGIETMANQANPQEDAVPVEMVPLPPPLIPTSNLIRSSITPASYPAIYNKVIIEGVTPKIPINLADMTQAIVTGWKARGEWPPTSQPIDQATVARKKKRSSWHAALDSSGFLSPSEGSRSIAMRGVGKVKKALGLVSEEAVMGAGKDEGEA